MAYHHLSERALGIAFLPGFIVNGTTCGPYNIVWGYNANVVPEGSTFNLGITNVGVPQFASTTLTTTTTTSSSTTGGATLPTISSSTNLGTFPGGTGTLTTPVETEIPGTFRKRADVTVLLAQAVDVYDNNHSLQLSALPVPPGWYQFFGSNVPGESFEFAPSNRFFVASGTSTDCLSSSTASAPSTSSTGASSSGSSTKPGVIAGAVVGGLAIALAAIGLCVFLACGSRRRSGRSQANSNHQQKPKAWNAISSRDSTQQQQQRRPVYRTTSGSLAARAASAVPHDPSETELGHDADEKASTTSSRSSPVADFLPRLPANAQRSSTSSASMLYGRPRGPASPVEGYPLGVLRSGSGSSHSHGALPPGAAPPSAPFAPSPSPVPGTKRTPRKPVPAYDAAADAQTEDEATVVGSHGSTSVLRKAGSKEGLAFPFVMNNGSSGQLHYLIPDLPPPQRE